MLCAVDKYLVILSFYQITMLCAIYYLSANALFVIIDLVLGSSLPG